MQEGSWGLLLVAPWSKARMVRQAELSEPVVCSDGGEVFSSFLCN